MDGYGPGTYGRSFAEVYDRWYPAPTDTAATVERLGRLAGEGAILELGVGTGRLLLPLAAPDRRTVGVDASAEMLERLSAKPGAEHVEIVEADMADLGGVDPRGGFSLVFVAVNTLFNVASGQAQLACLRGVAAVLAPGGRFVVEAFVPPDAADIPDTSMAPSAVELDRVVLTATRHDPAAQTIAGQHVELTEHDGVKLRPWFLRYATPAQLDEMAMSAGLRLETREAGWLGEPFTSASDQHVSIYRKPV